MITSLFLRKEKLISFVFLFLSCMVFNAQTPIVLYTGLGSTTPAPTNSRFTLNSLSGTLKQVRIQSNQTAAASTIGWAFHIGSTGSPDYSSCWRPYTGGNTLSVNTYIPTSFANGARFNSGGGGSDGLLPAITLNNYYTFNVSNSSSDNTMQLLETSYNPATLSSVTSAAGTYGSRTVNITTSTVPNASEYIYVRYSTNAFTSSTIVQATGSGTSWSASIPWQSSAVSYYVYSSNKTLSQINSDVSTYGQTAHDMSTLNLNNNSGSNYAWTPATGNFIVSSAGGSFATPVGYSSLTNASGVFAALNSATAGTGAVTILQTGDSTSEAGTNALNSSSNWSSVTLNPQGARTISGTVAAPLIDFNGADNVTFNGLNTGGNSLTVSNLSTSATSNTSTFRFINGATLNTITNSTILGGFSSTTITTNGGTIFFSNDGSTTAGNDGNIISNNNIGPVNGTSLPVKAIYGNGSTSTTAIGNSGITINNNNIYDFFNATAVSAGIYTNSGCNAWIITNNKFYQTATRTWTTGALHTPISINNLTTIQGAQGFTITGNTIGFANSSGTGAYTLTGSTGKFVGIYFSGITGGTSSDINNNTIANISLTGVSSSGTSSSSPFMGIYIDNGVATTSNNFIGSQSATGSLTYNSTSTTATEIYGIYNFSSNNWTSNANQIGGITANFGGTTTALIIYGLRANTLSGVTWTANSNLIGGTVANSIQNNSNSTAAQIVGLSVSASNGPLSTLTSNIIRNLTVAGGTGTTVNASAIGILVANTVNQAISQNTIYNLTNTNTSAATVVTGLQFTGGANNSVERNFIHGLTSSTSSTTGEISGIRIAGGTTTFKNNMVSLGVGVNNAIRIFGINEQSGTDNFYHNSVYVGGSPTSGTISTFAFNSVVTTNTRSFRNNIFVNARSNSGTASGKNYIISVAGTTANPTGLTLNYNVYHNSGTGTIFGVFNTGDVSDITAWRTVVGQDANSVSGDPQFISASASTPDLHIHPTNPTPVEAAGVAIATVTDDYDGQTRSGLTPTDIGADAGNFVTSIVACTAPTSLASSITVTSSGLTSISGSFTAAGSPVPTGYVVVRSTSNTLPTLTDATTYTVGANTTIATNGYVEYVGTSAGSWTSTSLTPNTTYYYYVFSYNNTSCSAGPKYSVTAKTANTATASCASFSSVISIGGSATVVGTTYPTLTAAIADLSICGLSQPTTLSLNSSYVSSSETFPITIPSLIGSSATNTLTLKPGSGVTATITGSNASAILKLNGADYVIIDGSNTVGGTSKNLTFANTNNGTASAVVWIATASSSNGATHNTIKNAIISGNSRTTTFGGIISSSTTGTNTASETDNAYNTVQNCTFTGSLFGIGTYGGASLDTGWTITGNTLGSATNGRAHYYGIDLYNAKDFTISNNIISGIFANNGNSSDVAAIEAYGTVSNGSIFGNKISDVTNGDNTVGYAGTGIYLGSTLASSNVSVYNNFLSDIKGAGFDNNFAAIGILTTSGGGFNIYNNSISINSSTQSSTTAGSTALLVNSGVSNLDIRNNIFYNYASIGSRFSIYSFGTSAAFNTINYNDYYSVGNIGYLGVVQSSLSAWQLATGQDANSINSLPPFVSANDLHITSGACSSLESAGTPISIVTNDIDNDIRSTTKPDIGADEFNGNIPPKITSVIPGSNCGAGTVVLSANGSTSGAAITEYRWYSSPSGGSPVGTSTNSIWTTPSISSTTNYYVVSYNGCESETRTLVTATINPAPTDIASITETQKSSTAIISACDVDYFELKATGGLVADPTQYAFGTQAAQNNTSGSSAYPAPYTVWYGGQRMQMLIRSSELVTAGFTTGSRISNIQFPVVSLGANWGSTLTSCNNFQVSIGATSLTSLSSFQTGLTQVVAPANFTPAVGYTNTHTFNSAFVWDGTSNIIVETTFSNNTTGVAANTVTQYISPTSYPSTIVYRADGVTASAAASATSITYSYSARPDFKLNGYTDTQKVTWSPSTGLYTDTALTTPYNGTDYLSTVYAAPTTATVYTAKAKIGTCEKSNVTSSIVRTRNEYIGAGTDWATASNWFPNAVPDANKCANIPAGKTVVIANDALAKSIKIASTGKLTINSGKSLTVTDAIDITNNISNDNLVLESDASLMQVNNVANTGNIYAKRDVKMRRMDYTFWSSPVSGQPLRNTGGTTNPNTYNTGGFSEGTPNGRIYYYDEPTDFFKMTTDVNFIPGKGYAIRGKDSYLPDGDIVSDTSLKFIGVPNNGNSLSVGIQKSKNGGTVGSPIEHGYNLIGNPYPSNLDFISFYNFDQGGGVYNRSKIYGKAWFWTNTSPVLTQNGSNYSGSNYAVLSLAGAVAATGVDNGNTVGSPMPTQYIKVGQGFIVQMRGTAPTGTTPNTATLKFDNSMRSNAAGIFYNNNKQDSQKNRYWLKLVSPENVSNMLLLAHIPEATNDYDADYDADLLTVGDDSFYSKLNTQKLQIQARAGFDNQDLIPLGAKYSVNGTYKIALITKEGIFSEGQKIYLHDKLSNTYQDLTQGEYSFTASKGLDENRFEIVYKDNLVLSNGDVSKSEFTIYRDGSDYVVKSGKKLGKVILYDASGRIVKTLSTNERTLRIDVTGIAEGVYIINVENSGEIKTKKIIK